MVGETGVVRQRTMNLLFVHQHFPGQFLHLVGALARAGHAVVFVTDASSGGEMRGVSKVAYRMAPASDRTHLDARHFDAAMRRAAAVAEVAAGLRAAGFQPDVIVGHEGWGETLNLADIWPDAPLLGYREYFYHETGADVGFDPEFPVAPVQAAGVRAKNAVGLLALIRGTPGVAPTVWQRSLYPAWARELIQVVADGVDLDACRPDPRARAAPLTLGGIHIGADQRLVTFVARDLEPYRGFHIFARALPRLLARPDVQVICVGGDGVSYGPPPPTGTWRGRMMAELGGRIDRSRLHFPGRVAHADHLAVLRRSDVHAYLSYPFIASWSLREALACGCAVVAGDTEPAREFVADGETGVLSPCLDPDAVADRVLALLDDHGRRARIQRAARAFAEEAMPMSRHLAGWDSLLRIVARH